MIQLAGTVPGVRAYMGIRFAAGPSGRMRWRPPQLRQPIGGTEDSREFAPDPMQLPSNELRGPRPGEDCLGLNIWSPAEGPDAKLPVMVWLYGGGFNVGSGSNHNCDGAALAAKGAVVVTLNYRLSIFGFLAHPALSAESPHGVSGNYGLLDQIAALTWVRDNIHAYGGDPGRVTLFGNSAGASSTSLLLASPLAEGLFHQAILQSSGIGPLADLADVEAQAARVLGPDIAAMRTLPAAALMARLGEFRPPLRPIRDGWVIPRASRDPVAAGLCRAMPMIIGGTANEGAFFLDGIPARTVTEYGNYLTATFGAFARAAGALYPARNDDEVPGAISAVIGDTRFHNGGRVLARANAGKGAKTFRYVFTHHPGGRAEPATHVDDTWYVFGTYPKLLADEKLAPTPADSAMAEAMMAAWVRFAATGDPNGGTLPEWPAFDAEGDRHLEFGDEIRAGSGWRRHQLDSLVDFYAARS